MLFYFIFAFYYYLFFLLYFIRPLIFLDILAKFARTVEYIDCIFAEE